MKTVFIYALCEPGTRTIRYVGKTHHILRRFNKHLADCNERNHYCACWIRSLMAKNLQPYLEILDEVPEYNWEFFERAYIKLYRELGFKLVNGTDGGEGSDGWKHSEASLKKMSISQSGQNNGMFNKRHSEKSKKKMSQTRIREGVALGEKNPMFGKPAPTRNKKQTTNTSGFVGVSQRKVNKKWKAFIGLKGKQIMLGDFSDISDAVFVRNLAMDKYYGGPGV